jgi:single-strand DNA-binding protein
MQLLIISGNVGNVKDVKEVGGDSVLNFSLAVDNGKDKNGQKRDATWYDCAIWGKRATSLQGYIEKGTKLSLSGRPSARAHDGKAYLGITVSELTFMGGGSGSGNGDAGGYQSGGASQRQSPPDDMDDSIPF